MDGIAETSVSYRHKDIKSVKAGNKACTGPGCATFLHSAPSLHTVLRHRLYSVHSPHMSIWPFVQIRRLGSKSIRLICSTIGQPIGPPIVPPIGPPIGHANSECTCYVRSSPLALVLCSHTTLCVPRCLQKEATTGGQQIPLEQASRGCLEARLPRPTVSCTMASSCVIVCLTVPVLRARAA